MQPRRKRQPCASATSTEHMTSLHVISLDRSYYTCVCMQGQGCSMVSTTALFALVMHVVATQDTADIFDFE